MPSTYSNLKIQLMSTGENNTSWGDVTNLNLGTAIEEAISGSADVTFASGNVTLTLTDTNASQTARNMRLNCIGTTGGAARNLIVPAIEKMYVVRNGCADAITIKNLTGTGITVPAGQTTMVFNDGTNVVDAVTALSSLSVAGVGSVGGNFTVSGTLTVSGQTALRGTAYFGATGAVNIDGDTNTLYLRGTNVAWQDAGATTTRMYLNSSGNLGVGTTTPDVRLTVQDSGSVGQITLKDSSGTTQGFVGTNSIIGTAPANALRLRGEGGVALGALGQLALFVNTSANVGIGTTSPSQRLHVRQDQSGTTAALIQNRNATGSPVSAVQFISGAYDLSDNRYAMIASDGGPNTTLQFWTGQGATPVERMRIDSSGNVGIGTTSPIGAVGYGWLTLNGSSNGAATSWSTAGTENFRVQINNSLSAVYLNTISNWPMLFQTNNTERMRIDASGNVGIGTSSPSTKLDVNGTIRINAANSFQWYGASSGVDQKFWDTYSTNSGTNTLFFRAVNDAYNAAYQWLAVDRSGFQPQNIMFYTGAGSERMRIDSSGNVGIGTTSPGARLSAETTNDGVFSTNYTGANSAFTAVTFLKSGVIHGSISGTATTTSYNTSSDYRLKEDLQPVTNALARLDQLKVWNFAWKLDGSRTDGFIAHEVALVVPGAVHGEKDAVDDEGNPVYQGIDQSKLVPLLVAAVQELRARVAQLEGGAL